MAYSPHAEMLATGDAEGAVRLWDAASNKPLATLSGHADAVLAVAFSLDGSLLASAGSDNVIKIWNIAERKTQCTLTGHANWVQAVAFTPDGKTLISGGADRSVKLWDVAAGGLRATLPDHGGAVWAVAAAPDGKTFASSSSDRTIRIWDLETHEIRATLRGHTGFVRGLAYSPDGELLASASEDNTALVWDLAKQKVRHTLSAHAQGVAAVAFSPRGQLLATGSFDRTIKLWEVASGGELATLEGHNDGVRSLAFSPAGRELASAASEKTISRWTALLPRIMALRTERIVQGPRAVAAVSADGQMLATAGDNTILIRDLASGELRATLSGHRGSIVQIAFSPDGRLLASASRDRTGKLWDVSGGRLISSLDGHRGAVTAVAFSPDGRTLATAGADRAILLWDVPPAGGRPGDIARAGHLDRAHGQDHLAGIFSRREVALERQRLESRRQDGGTQAVGCGWTAAKSSLGKTFPRASPLWPSRRTIRRSPWVARMECSAFSIRLPESRCLPDRGKARSAHWRSQPTEMNCSPAMPDTAWSYGTPTIGERRPCWWDIRSDHLARQSRPVRPTKWPFHRPKTSR